MFMNADHIMSKPVMFMPAAATLTIAHTYCLVSVFTGHTDKQSLVLVKLIEGSSLSGMVWAYEYNAQGQK